VARSSLTPIRAPMRTDWMPCLLPRVGPANTRSRRWATSPGWRKARASWAEKSLWRARCYEFRGSWVISTRTSTRMRP